MANNCLVTKLKEIVDNNNLEYLNAFTIISNGNRSLNEGIRFYGDTSGKTIHLKIISGNGSFSDSTIVTETTLTLSTSDQTYGYKTGTGIRSLDGNPVKVNIENLKDLSTIISGFDSAASLNLSRLFLYLPNIKWFNELGNAQRNYALQLDSLDDIPASIIELTLSNVCTLSAEENVSKLAKLVNATKIEIADTDKIVGNILALGELTNLTLLSLAKQRLEGSLEEFAEAQITAGRPNNTAITFRVYGGNNNVTYKGSKDNINYYTVIHFDSSRPEGYYVTGQNGQEY